MTTEANRVAEKIGLSNARADLGWTQETLAKKANVSKPTIIGAEGGKKIYRLKACAIWNTINRERDARGLEPFRFDDLDIRLRD